MANQFSPRLLRKEEIAKDIYSFYFDKPEDFIFIPGQYIRMFLNHKSPDIKGSSRFFSIASTPLDKFIMITTKIRESSFKKALLNLKLGQSLLMFGPIGEFHLNTSNSKKLVFLSGGMGITPYYSIINYIHLKRLQKSVILLASFNAKKDVIYYENLKKIAYENHSIKIIYTISGDNRINKERIDEHGRITGSLIKKCVPNFEISKFYITGPQKMTDSLIQILINLNISERNIIYEKFSGY